jgi:hypothetical protein
LFAPNKGVVNHHFYADSFATKITTYLNNNYRPLQQEKKINGY